MKNNLLLIVLLLSSIPIAFAQGFNKFHATTQDPFSELDPLYFFPNQINFDEDWWQPDTIIYYDNYSQLNRRVLYSYNTNGYITKFLSQDYLDNVWENFSERTYEYDGNNLIKELRYIYSNGQQKNSQRDTYTYDNQNRLFQHKIEVYISTFWFNMYLYTYNYNDNNTLKSILIQYYSGEELINSNKTSYSYDENKNITEEILESWINTYWKNERKTIYTYENNNLSNKIVQTAKNNEWTNSEQFIYTYENNKVKSCIYQEWMSLQYIWENIECYSYGYDNFENNTSYTRQYWLNWEWHDYERVLYSFNNNLLTEKIVEIIDNKSKGWENYSKTSFEYDDNNNGKIVKYFKWTYYGWEIYTAENIYIPYNNMQSIYSSVYECSQIQLSYKKTAKPAGIEEVEQLTQEIIIYPNPAKDNINISVENDKIRNVQIFNITGKLVKQEKSNKINIIGLPVGMYIIKVETEGGNFIKKVIKD